MAIYVSTSCLKNPKNVTNVLREYEKADIDNIELGSVHDYFDINVLKKFDFNYLIHNYFPPPKNAFNFNLASCNDIVRSSSISLAKKAMAICSSINAPLYTFHAGFTVDPPELGRPFPRDNIPKRGNALRIYNESLVDLIDYSKSCGIKIAMEPNVVQKFNLVDNENKLCLFADFEEIKLLKSFFQKDELGILLDLGHTAVTAHWLNYNKDEFVEQCRKWVYAIHVSHNNGRADQHRSLTKNSWQVSKLKSFKKKPIILETMNLSTDKIRANIDLVNDVIN